MRSGSVKHRHTFSRGASNTPVTTKSLVASVIICPSTRVLRAPRRNGRYCAAITIQCTPNLSASMPKRGEKKVLVNGCVTFPPSTSTERTARLKSP
jgi:hypothetical protein